MFLGHFAVGFGSKRFAPQASLGALMAAPLLCDLLWPLFLAVGWEQVRIDPGNTAVTPLAFDRYPFSHSLAAVVVWGVLSSLLYGLVTGYRAGAVVIGLGVLSHWVLDFLTHRPDLPLYPGGGLRVGLGLWNSTAGTVFVEALLFGIGVWMYRVTTRAMDRIGRHALGILLLVLVLLYAGNLLGPPPPSVATLKSVSFGVWLFPLWAGWLDRHRALR